MFVRWMRDFLEAVSPTPQPMGPVAPAPPQPVGNVPAKHRMGMWIVSGGLVLLLIFFAFNRAPVSPLQVKTRVAATPTTTLTPEQIHNSGLELQNQTNREIDSSQKQNGKSDQFAMQPENAGIPDPNYAAQMRAAPQYPISNTTADNSQQQQQQERAKQMDLIAKALHASPYVAPTQMAGLSQPVAAKTTAAVPAQDRDTAPVSEPESKRKYDWSKYEGDLRRLLAGNVLRGVTKNRIEGSYTGPLVVQITDDVYTHDRAQLLMKAGSTLIGAAKAVNSQWQSRVEVKFTRIIMPDGFSQELSDVPGLSQSGENGLRDKVNRHYGQTFGAALAIGALGGLSQLGNSYSGFGYDPGTSIRNGITQSMGQASQRIFDRYSQRPPELLIREGTRVSLILSDDVLLPEYRRHLMPNDL